MPRKMLRVFYVFLNLTIGMVCYAASHAESYHADLKSSTISFSGEHVGEAFFGKFREWQANIVTDDASQKLSKIEAKFVLSSAKTGSKMYDGTLPEEDWFDVENHPEAYFKSTELTKKETGVYLIVGDLTLKDVTKTIEFQLTFSSLSATPIHITGTFPIDRLAYRVGLESDPDAEWVSQFITVTLNLKMASSG